MKKYLCLIVVMMAAIGFSNDTYANEKVDVSVEETSIQEKAGNKMFKGMHKNHKISKKHHQKNKHHKKLKVAKTPLYSSPIMQCQIEDMDGEYQDILAEIASSSMSQDARKLLSTQAEETYNLALKQLKERMDLRAKQACERMPYGCEFFTDKQNRKILRDIDKLFD